MRELTDDEAIEMAIINDTAIELINMGRPEAAAEKLMGALEKGLEYYILYNTLGMAYLNSHNAYRASLNFQIAIDMNPRNDMLHANLAAAYIELGRENDAIEELKKAVKFGYREPSLFKDAIALCEKHCRFQDSSYFSMVQEGLFNP